MRISALMFEGTSRGIKGGALGSTLLASVSQRFEAPLLQMEWLSETLPVSGVVLPSNALLGVDGGIGDDELVSWLVARLGVFPGPLTAVVWLTTELLLKGSMTTAVSLPSPLFASRLACVSDMLAAFDRSDDSGGSCM